jgi:hypothetical protein
MDASPVPDPKKRNSESAQKDSRPGPAAIEISVLHPNVLWTMAESGQLSTHKLGRPGEVLSDDAFELDFKNGQLTLEIKIKSAVRDLFAKVDFDSAAFNSLLSQGSSSARKYDAARRVVTVLQGRPGRVVELAHFPGEGAVERTFTYSSAPPAINSAAKFKSAIEEALQLLRAYLVYGFEKAGKPIPLGKLVVQPPAQFLRETSEKTEQKKVSRVERHAREGEVLHEEDGIFIVKPQGKLEQIKGFPHAVADLGITIEKFNDPAVRAREAKLGLCGPKLVVIEGGEEHLRYRLAEACAAELRAGLCEIEVDPVDDDFRSMCEDALVKAEKYRNRFLGKTMVFHVVCLAPYILEWEPEQPVRHIFSIDPLLTALRDSKKWPSTLCLCTVDDSSLIQPTTLAKAELRSDAYFTVKGAAELLAHEFGELAKRAGGGIRLGIDFEHVAKEMFSTGQRPTPDDITYILEASVRSWGEASSAFRKAPLTGGSVLGAWDLFCRRRDCV